MLLFQRLDEDGNSRLEARELNRSALNLLRWDYDEDETVSLAELQPLRNPLLEVPQSVLRTTAGELPFVHVDETWTAEVWRLQLTRRYGVTDSHAIPHLPTLVMRLVCPQVERYDGDRDGQLSADELLIACQDVQPSARIRIDLPLHRSSAGQAKLEWQHDSLKGRIPRLPTSVLRWSLDGLPIEVAARASRIQLGDARDFYLQRFVVADADKDDQLTADEYAALELGSID